MSNSLKGSPELFSFFMTLTFESRFSPSIRVKKVSVTNEENREEDHIDGLLKRMFPSLPTLPR